MWLGGKEIAAGGIAVWGHRKRDRDGRCVGSGKEMREGRVDGSGMFNNEEQSSPELWVGSMKGCKNGAKAAIN